MPPRTPSKKSFDASMGPALIDVKVTMTSAHGWKPVVFHYQKKCGGHKNGFRVWLPSSHMVNGNDRTKRIVYGAGEKKLMSPSTEAGDLERKEEEETRRRRIQCRRQGREEDEKRTRRGRGMKQ